MKAIIVGLGGRGRYWLGECSKRDDLEITAFVEPVEANWRRAVTDHGVDEKLVYPDLGQALTEVGADFVLDVTPPAIHETIAATAFKAGCHVLGEKPISDDFAAAKRIVDDGRKRGLKHMITQNYRFNPLPRATRRLLSEGVIGTVGQLDVSLYVNWADVPGSHYVTEPFMFLTDMGIHHFDMMRYTLDVEPVSVRAITWNLPWGWHKGDACQLIHFQFEGGVVATHRGVACTMGHVPAGHNGEWRYEGPHGTLTWEGFQLFHTALHKADPQVRREIELPQPGPDVGNPVLAEFISALRDDREPECNAQDNLNSLTMAFAAVRSAQEDREVAMSEFKEPATS